VKFKKKPRVNRLVNTTRDYLNRLIRMRRSNFASSDVNNHFVISFSPNELPSIKPLLQFLKKNQGSLFDGI
jgi:hypothetical protein